MGENLRVAVNFSSHCAQCTLWNIRKFTLTDLSQKFREINVFTNKVTKELISRENISVRENFAFFHAVQCATHTLWKKHKISLTQNIFREINSLVTSLIKTLLSRNFCQKTLRVNFGNFHTVTHSVEKLEIHCHAIFFRQINL